MKLVLVEYPNGAKHGVDSLSPACLKANRALRKAGLSYERRHVFDPRTLSRINPLKQMPVLLADEKPIPDSTYILRFIEGVNAEAWSKHPEAWLWEEYADRALYPHVVASRWVDDNNWPITRAAYFGGMPAVPRLFVPEMLRKGVTKRLIVSDVVRTGDSEMWGEFQKQLDHLEGRAPVERFWLGEFTVADLGLFSMLQSFRTSLTPRQKGFVETRKKLAAYLDRVEAETGGGPTA